MKTEPSQPIAFSVKPAGAAGTFQISLGARDFLGSFSIVTGLLSSYGLNIIRGSVNVTGDTPKEKRVSISLRVVVRKAPVWQAL